MAQDIHVVDQQVAIVAHVAELVAIVVILTLMVILLVVVGTIRTSMSVIIAVGAGKFVEYVVRLVFVVIRFMKKIVPLYVRIVMVQ